MDFNKLTAKIENISDFEIRNIAELLIEAIRTYPKQFMNIWEFLNEIKLLLQAELISIDLIESYLKGISKEDETDDNIFWVRDSLSALADAIELSEMRGYKIEDIIKLMVDNNEID